MADPLTDAYNKEIQRRKGPLGFAPATSKGGAALQFPLEVVEGLGQVLPFGIDTLNAAGAGIINYLEGPSKFSRDVKSGKIPESEIPLGTDLVDIFDGEGSMGMPDFVPNDLGLGEKFTYDPTGEGKTKSVELQKKINAMGTVGGRGKFAEAPTERADYLKKEKEEQRSLAAEAFREKEKQLVDSQGGLNSMSVADSKNSAEQLFAASMEDFISGVRGKGPETNKVRDIEEYKDEFFKATGIKTPGKINAGAALMAAGATMMQNQMGGKGFSGMMTTLGQASEKALPELIKAREKVDLESRAAGKYAIEMRNSDQAAALAAKEKSMQRSDYFIVPKANNVVDFLVNSVANGQGKLETLNRSELNALQMDPKFREQFDILPGSMWGTVVEEALKTEDASKLWDTGVQTRSLIYENKDPLLQIDVSYGLPGTSKEGEYVVRDATQLKLAEGQLLRMSRDLVKAKDQFVELGILTSENRNVFTYGVDKLNSLASAFGVKIGEKETETDTIIRILENIAMKKAPDILGESGKTISDGDRERVERIVGQLKATGDIRTTRARINELFNDIILGAESDINQGLTSLGEYTGTDYGLKAGKPLSEEEASELSAYQGKKGSGDQ